MFVLFVGVGQCLRRVIAVFLIMFGDGGGAWIVLDVRCYPQ